MTEPVYEMCWDCGNCGQKELLGLTHRHCPNCGAPQDPDKRYFPAEDRKVAVHDHQFVGRDRECAYCGEANAASAVHCTGCGAPLADGSQAVQLQPSPDHQVAQAAMLGATSPAPTKRSRAGMFILIALAAVVVLGIVFMFWTEKASVSVSGHQWTRSVEIQSLQSLSRGAWCDQLPQGAYSIRREQRQRSTRRIPDGETCSNVNVDNGDGTYRQERQCEPRYREEPVYDSYCNFQIDDWAHQSWQHARGDSTSPAPTWPTYSVTGCQTLGCTRRGQTQERNTVLFRRDDSTETYDCDFELTRWMSLGIGQTMEAEFRVIGGGIDCDSVGGTSTTADAEEGTSPPPTAVPSPPSDKDEPPTAIK